MPFRAQTDFAYRLTAKPGRGDLTAIDLFSGAGGLTLGLLNAGFDVRLSSDIDAGCELTHRVNLPRIPFIAADLNKLSGLDILREAGLRRGELDLLAGGPPCQGFSIIGERDHTDTRNQLFSHFINMVDQIRPRAVLIENVPGLATLNKGMMLGHISRLFRKAGYRATCAEILSAQYGVPQMRWRMAFIAWREDTEIAHAGFPRPTHGTAAIGDLFPNRTLTDEETGGFLTAADAISDLPPIGSGEEGSIYTGKPASPYQQAMRAGLTTELFNHYAPRLNEANLRRLEHLKEGQDWRDLPRHLLPESMKRALRKDHTRRYSRMCWDATPRAIITRFRDPKSGEYTHPNQHRTISIREAARIQSFPDWFQFMGAHTDQYNQVGNAVPPLMGRAIGTEIARCLRDKKVRVHTAPKSRYVLPEGEQLKLQFAL